MARLNLAFIAVFLVLAVCALSLPTKRDSTGLGLDAALEDLESYTKIMKGLGVEDSNDKDNKVQKEKPATGASEIQGSHQQYYEKPDVQSKTDDQPTRTEKKPTSGKFVTPTVTNTHHPTSKPNMLGKLPIVGGLLGGTGGL